MTSARVVLGGLSGAVLLAVAGPVFAQETPYDWTLNVNDNGHDPTPVNGTVVYSVSVENNGDSRAPANKLTFHIPQGGRATAVAGGLSPADCSPALPLPLPGPAVLTCMLPPMNPSEVLHATFDMVASERGVLNYTFVVDSESDSNPDDNTITSTTTISAGADLELEITGPDTAAAGSTVAFSATVRPRFRSRHCRARRSS